MSKRIESEFYKNKAKEKLSLNGIKHPKPLVTKEEYLDGKEIAICEKHGEFEVQFLDGIIKMVYSTCQGCVDEYQSKVTELAEKLEQEEEQRLLDNRIFNSGVSERHFDKTFDNYVADTDERKFALDSMKYFCKKIEEGECKNMILCGSVGTGKTHLCQAAIRYFAETTHPSEFSMKMATITQIIRYYRASWDKNTDYSEQDAINNLSNQSLLIIDELGVQNGTDNEINIIFEIINNRYENKLPTVIISNLEKDEVVNLLGNRIIDRLKEDGCRVLGMQWDSYRETNKSNF
jgi:DNA replication protein DnaC